MGLGRTTRVFVSSVVYNLAGDEDDRADFLKTTVLTSAIAEKDMPESIVSSYIKGPGIRLRNFANWAETSGYNTATGNSGGNILAKSSVDLEALLTQIPVTVGTTAVISQAEIDSADFTYWADQYISQNHPGLLGTLYSVDMDAVANLITITYEDETTDSFTPVNFDFTARYLYATYTEQSPPVFGVVSEGATIILGSGDDFPDIVDWEEESNVVIPHIAVLDKLTTVDVTYSDSTPPTHTDTTETVNQDYNEIHALYEQHIQLPPPVNQDVIRTNIRSMYQDTVGSISTDTTVTVTTETLVGGVIKTTTTTVTEDTLEIERTHHIDEQIVTYANTSSIKIFIYKEGDGNLVLEPMFSSAADFGKFFPIVPFRLNNVSMHKEAYSYERPVYDFVDGDYVQIGTETVNVSEYISPYYEIGKKALKKATGAKYDKVLENIEGNASIGDIDFAYAAFGVSLNVKENACKRYIHQFFKQVMQDPNITDPFVYDVWVDQWNTAHASQIAWIEWKEDPYTGPDMNRQLLPEPEKIPYPAMPVNSMSVDLGLNYRVIIGWNFIAEETGFGLLKPDAERGDCWLTIGATDSFVEVVWTQDGDDSIFKRTFGREINNDLIHVNFQETDNTWSRLTIRGLNYKNYIYGANYVEIGSAQALQDTEESGFIIPLHENVYNSMGLVQKTQMATACCFLVFNCYVTKRTRWYETALFQIVLIVVLVVITVMSFGTSSPITGPAIAVVSALGLTGTAALVVAFVVNAIVATLIFKALTRIATHFWGEKVGLIVGVIGSIIALNIVNGFFSGASLASSFGNLMSAPNLLMLLNSSVNAYTDYMSAATQDLNTEMMQFQNEYTAKLEEITNKTNEMFGSNSLLSGSQVADILLQSNESPEAFLQRTLMVGSDIAEMSISMLNNFVDMTLSTDLV